MNFTKFVAKICKWEYAQLSPVKSLNEVLDKAKLLNPVVQEGFVVSDTKFRRIKVKSPSYIALSYLGEKDKQGLNKQRLLEIARLNEGDEFLTYYPTYRSVYENVKYLYELAITKAEQIWPSVQSINDTKEFELAIQKGCTGVGVQALRAFKVSNIPIRITFETVNIKKLLSYIEDFEAGLELIEE